MNNKSVLYILLTALGIILVYNYMIAPLLLQPYNGMGMHWRMYNINRYYVDFRLIILIVVVIAGILLFEILKPQNKSNKCSKCGKYIENNRWRICPICGTPVNNGKGDN